LTHAPNVKGSVLRARVQYVAARGPEAQRRFVGALSATAREHVEAGFLANVWYPFALLVELSEVIDRQLGAGDLALCYELGRHACDVNLPTLYKVFFRIGSLRYILGRAAAAWRVNYDAGEMQLVDEGPRSARLRVVGFPAPHRAHCLSVKGWIVRAAELTGARSVEAREQCKLLGHNDCEFALTWT
jgi:hypothetical protein